MQFQAAATSQAQQNFPPVIDLDAYPGWCDLVTK
jgi:hypothetical protein